jgi:hypothetical protein
MVYAIGLNPPQDRGQDTRVLARAHRAADLPAGPGWVRHRGALGEAVDVCGLPTGRWSRTFDELPYETAIRRVPEAWRFTVTYESLAGLDAL